MLLIFSFLNVEQAAHNNMNRNQTTFSSIQQLIGLRSTSFFLFHKQKKKKTNAKHITFNTVIVIHSFSFMNTDIILFGWKPQYIQKVREKVKHKFNIDIRYRNCFFFGFQQVWIVWNLVCS